jgi:hypothetical protein
MADKRPAFISTYCAWAREATDAPPDFHPFVALGILSTALGKRIWIEAAWGRIYPHLWLCFVAPSGVRKSAAIWIGANILTDAIPEALLVDDFTREALISSLTQQSAGLLVWDEFAEKLELMKRDYMRGVMEFITRAYDSRPVKRRTQKDGTVSIQDTALGIMAATTVEWLEERLRARDLAGGFVARMLFITADQMGPPKPPFPMGNAANYQVRESLVHHLQALTNMEGRLEVEDKEGFVSWQTKFELEMRADGAMAPFVNRASVQALKLGMAYQASAGFASEHGHYLLGPECMQKGIRAYESAYQRTRYIISERMAVDKDSVILRRLRDMMGSAQGRNEPLWERDIYRSLSMEAPKVQRYVDTLLRGREWDRTVQRPGSQGGRPKVGYVAVED